MLLPIDLSYIYYSNKQKVLHSSIQKEKGHLVYMRNLLKEFILHDAALYNVYIEPLLYLLWGKDKYVMYCAFSFHLFFTLFLLHLFI